MKSDEIKKCNHSSQKECECICHQPYKFDYTVCIKRVVSELIKQRDLNSKIACGHSKKDLWKECHSDSIEYCTICRLHQEIEENEIKANNWRHAVESALGLESDEVNHTPEWAFDIILKIREIGNRK